MIFSLEVQRALEGDCFMMHYGPKDDPGLVLIDGGPSQVYNPDLKTRIGEIRKNRGLVNEKPLWVDLLIVSHIDDDHIQGILDLMDDLANDHEAGRPLPLKIQNFWHNTVNKIIGNDPDELLTVASATFGAAALSGEIETEGLDPEVAKILASLPHGLELYDSLVKLDWKNRINLEFKGNAVMAQKGGDPIEMPRGGLKLTVVGPMRPEIEKLQKKYESYLKKHPEERKKVSILATITKDDSFSNLSSIVVLAEAEGKRILLPGDARSDKILQGLQLTGLLGSGKESTIHVDVLKVPHHGSIRNIKEDFFKRVIADHYVFSANGKYGNPDRSTMEMLWNVRKDEDYTIHLTYPIEEIDQERQKDWISQQNKEGATSDWSPGKQSLKAFFDEHKTFFNEQKLKIVKEGEPHIIDLLEDKVGF